jgi:hypothetical protein
MIEPFAVLALILASQPAVPPGTPGPDPAYVARADQAHFWLPTMAEVQALDGKIKVPERMGGPIANFRRFYTGLYRNGHRVIALTLLEYVKSDQDDRVRIVEPKDVPAIADGGCMVMAWSKDLDTGVGSDLVCNASLPPPPPPPPQDSQGSSAR